MEQDKPYFRVHLGLNIGPRSQIFRQKITAKVSNQIYSNWAHFCYENIMQILIISPPPPPQKKLF